MDGYALGRYPGIAFPLCYANKKSYFLHFFGCIMCKSVYSNIWS